jgi:hypothetical protein
MATLIPSTSHPDVVLIGAGIMSTTLAVVLKRHDSQSTSCLTFLDSQQI